MPIGQQGGPESHWKMDDKNQWVLPERIEHFVDWITNPEKSPPSMRQYAIEHGWSYWTVRNWRKDPRVVKAIDAKLAEFNISPERTQAVVDAIWQRAVSGDPNAQRLYLEHTGKFTPTQRVIQRDDSVEEMTDDEIRSALGIE